MPPATASRSFARQNAPLVSHSYPRTPIVRPLLTQQPAPFPNIANGSLYIHPFDSAKPPCPLLQSILTVKTLFHRPACAQKRFAPPAPNSAIKARFHRPDYAKKRPKHLSSASKSLLQSAPCSAHRKKTRKNAPVCPVKPFVTYRHDERKTCPLPVNKRHTRRAVPARRHTTTNSQKKRRKQCPRSNYSHGTRRQSEKNKNGYPRHHN